MITVRPYRKNGVDEGWEADIRVRVDGRQIRRRLKSDYASRRATEKWAERLAESWISGAVQPGRVESPAPTIDEFVRGELQVHLAQMGLKPGSLAAWESALRRIVQVYGGRKVSSFSAKDLFDFRATMAGLSNSTINGQVRYLQSLLRIAGERGHDVSVPEIKPLRKQEVEVEPYTSEELDALIHTSALAPAERLAFIRLGCDGGLRAGEIGALRWGDIAGGAMAIRSSYDTHRKVLHTTKTGKVRRVPISLPLSEALLRLDQSTEFVLGDSPCPRWRLSRWLRRLERDSDLPETGRVHRLRHTFATRLMEAGIPPSVIQSLGGWSSLQMVQRYSHVRPGVAANAISQALSGSTWRDLGKFPSSVG